VFSIGKFLIQKSMDYLTSYFLGFTLERDGPVAGYQKGSKVMVHRFIGN